jgi:hypothetical protein
MGFQYSVVSWNGTVSRMTSARIREGSGTPISGVISSAGRIPRGLRPGEVAGELAEGFLGLFPEVTDEVRGGSRGR